LTNRSDKALVAASRGGNREAYAELVRRYSKRVFAVCYGFVRGVEDAEDLAQEALLKGYRKIARLGDGAKFGSWISRIARNTCLDHLRRRPRREIALVDLPERPDPRSELKPEHIDLREAIGRLPEEYRVPLLSYYFNGRNTNHIAEALGISRATVHTRLSRARRELRRLLKDTEESP
jgi:RNA polymerase sigma-70 factor (ECF subfamily)